MMFSNRARAARAAAFNQTVFKQAVLTAAAGLALSAVPAWAQADQAEQGVAQPSKPISDQDIDARDVAMTPLSDLNLKKGEIPALLIEAQYNPYTLRGLGRCAQIAAAVGELDAILGADIDLAQASGGRINPGRAAQAAIGSFIPFRGLIREVSGANAQERKLQAAIFAGTARRSFLKGIGQQRGCRYPARSATPDIMAAYENHADNDRQDDARAPVVSRPVVQPIP